jgi:hypothetical protein
MRSSRLFGPAAMGAVVFPLLGCPSEELCCTEFKVGATIGGEIGGSARSQVAVQAVADVSAIASALVDDLTTSCRSIAQDLDAPKAEQDAAEGTSDKNARLDAWCALAVKSIGTVKASAGGSLAIVAQPPKCAASVSAKASCQAKCSGSASCDLEANPPRCTGGKLQVACKGECTANAGATLSCEGKCEGGCKGSCTATGGVAVKCDGKCDGTCAAGGTAGETGIQADGSCKGTCQGTCTARAEAPALECSGSCNGECGVKCTGSANASVKCDGTCSADFEPLKCEGGKLEGGCEVEASCDANCDASVQAKAECTPPEVKVTFSGAANVEAAAKLVATLEANLGVVFALDARVQGMLSASASFGTNVQGIADIKVACIPPVGAAAKDALADVQSSSTTSAKLLGAAR